MADRTVRKRVRGVSLAYGLLLAGAFSLAIWFAMIEMVIIAVNAR